MHCLSSISHFKNIIERGPEKVNKVYFRRTLIFGQNARNRPYFYKENVKYRFITLVLRRWGSKLLFLKIGTSADYSTRTLRKAAPEIHKFPFWNPKYIGFPEVTCTLCK